MNEVQDISSKGWDLLGTVYQKAKEQIIGAGILALRRAFAWRIFCGACALRDGYNSENEV